MIETLSSLLLEYSISFIAKFKNTVTGVHGMGMTFSFTGYTLPKQCTCSIYTSGVPII